LIEAQTINLIGGSIAGSAASHSVDMVGDLKTGYLLNATPRSQFYGQIVGAFFSIFSGVGFYMLFSKAYPCINDESIEECPFALAAPTAWAAVTKVLTDPKLSIPTSSLWACLVCAVVCIVVFGAKLLAPKSWRPYFPNLGAIGLAFVLNTNVYSIAMAMGALIGWVWGKRAPKSWELVGIALSSGLITGEGKQSLSI
jgi:uncharacterized oligopeptide transporter (OPT) family protein